MVTHSSILAWEIPWTEEPGGLQSMELQQSDMTQRLNSNTNLSGSVFCNVNTVRSYIIKSIVCNLVKDLFN